MTKCQNEVPAIYGRVSSEQQAEAATIDSQVAALQERIVSVAAKLGASFAGPGGRNARALIATDRGQAGRRLLEHVERRNRGNYAGRKEARRR
jgi:hypothetical protein